MKEKVSIIMSCYNEPISYIQKSVNSILKQSYRNIEFIIIIDNPNRLDIVNYLKKIAKQDKRVLFCINKDNMGLTESLNKAIEKTTGKYIARMDADDISMPERIEIQLRYLKDKKLNLIGCRTVNIDSSDTVIGNKENYYPSSPQIIKKYLKYNSPLAHPTWFGDAAIFKEYKYIDYIACEDYELLTRLSLDGKKLGNVDKVLLKYRSNDNGISSNKLATQKTSLHYVSSEYKKESKSNYEEYKKYIKSKDGKIYNIKVKKYYDIVKNIKNKLHSRHYFSAIAKSFELIKIRKIAIEKITNSLSCRILTIRDKRMSK